MQELYNKVEELCNGWVKEYDPSIHSLDNFEMRDIDKEEVLASTGKSPIISLQNSIKYSKRVWVIHKEDKIIAVFGIGSWDGCGIPWLLASLEMREYVGSISFIRSSRRVIGLFNNVYPCLNNFVLSTNTESIKYIKLLGFTVLEHTPYTLHDPNKYFYMFHKET